MYVLGNHIKVTIPKNKTKQQSAVRIFDQLKNVWF